MEVVKHELFRFSWIYLGLAFVNLRVKLFVTTAWYNGSLSDMHQRLLAFDFFNHEQSRLLQFWIPELFHQLLVTLAFCALEETRPRGHIEVSVAAATGGGVVFAVEDDGPEDVDLPDWPNQPPRGRTLACAVAAHLAEGLGGRLDIHRRDDRTRIELTMPPEETGR